MLIHNDDAMVTQTRTLTIQYLFIFMNLKTLSFEDFSGELEAAVKSFSELKDGIDDDDDRRRQVSCEFILSPISKFVSPNRTVHFKIDRLSVNLQHRWI